mmetsp:Transcript_40992/g.107669  ORF Transcript_40992/g.107669 Transcript_40992/m.107669 type:complete len:305 (-) Transcript_40992:93-1007(-)
MRLPEPGNHIHGLLGADELPHPIRAHDRKLGLLRHLHRHDVGDFRHADRVGHVVPEGSGHRESRVHLALGEHTVGDIPRELADLPSRLLNALPLLIQFRLMVRRQILRPPLAPLLPRQHRPRVPRVRRVQHARPVEHHRAGRPREARVELAFLPLHEVVGGFECGGERLVGFGFEGGVTEDLPGEHLVDEEGDVVAAGAVAVEDAVHAPVVHLQNEEIILVWAFRLEALLARKPHVMRCQDVLVPHQVHLLILKPLLRPGSVRPADTHLPPGIREEVHHIIPCCHGVKPLAVISLSLHLVSLGN